MDNSVRANKFVSREEFDAYFIDEGLLPSEAIELEKRFTVEKFKVELKEEPVWADLTSLKVYLADMRDLLKNNPPLTVDEERELSYIVLNSKKNSFEYIQARNTLVERNLPFAYWMAKKFQHRVTNSVGFEDLIQVCNKGLINAAESFDGTKEARFTSYAYWWILSSVHRTLSHEAYTIKVPDRYLARFNRLKIAEDAVKERLGQDNVPVEEVIEEHNRRFYKDALSLQLGKEIMALRPTAISLDEQISYSDKGVHDETEKTWEDSDMLTTSESLESIIEDNVCKEILLNLVMSVLNENERTVIMSCYGLNNGGVALKQRTVADRLGISPQRVSMIQKTAEAKLKKAMTKIHFEEMLGR